MTRGDPWPLVAAMALLAVAMLLAGSRAGLGRLRALTAPAAIADAPQGVHPWWIAVGALATCAAVWAALGGTGGVVTGLVAGLGAGVLARWIATRPDVPDDDGAALAGAWELLAVCLEVGLPVAAAVAAAAAPLSGATGHELRRVAGLLELGADPAQAWGAAAGRPALAAFARAAGRSAATGAALAQVGRTEGARIRSDLVDSAQARAQRAGVLITGPLGLCFLPAFLVLGIAPVVIGLAGKALARW